MRRGKELTLAEKWAIDDGQIEAQSRERRIRNAVYGGLIGNAAWASYTNKLWNGISLAELPALPEPPPAPGRQLCALGELVFKKDGPLAFTLERDLTVKEALDHIRSLPEFAGDDVSGQLGRGLYLRILWCLYHYDDFETAVDTTLEDAYSDLRNTGYEGVLPHYAGLGSGRIKGLSKNNIGGGSIFDCLRASLWCCVNNRSSFQEVILAAAGLDSQTPDIAVASGTLAGLYFREDVAVFLPKSGED
jgi:hypothetical protein